MSFLTMPNPAAARRLFLGQSGLVLSGAAIALLAGNDALAAKTQGGAATDIQILNTALGAELEAIAAYQLGADSKLLQKPALDLAVTREIEGAGRERTCPEKAIVGAHPSAPTSSSRSTGQPAAGPSTPAPSMSSSRR